MSHTYLAQGFYNLDPVNILACAEKHGFLTTGQLQQLNSYENRVFDISLEPESLKARFLQSDLQMKKNQKEIAKEKLAASDHTVHSRVEEDLFYNTTSSNIIGKFYRPNRWSKETILAEHEFEIELKNEGLSVAVPYVLNNGFTVDQDDNGIYYAFFEKVRGRMMQEFLPEHFLRLGRWLAQLHNVGERKEALQRAYLGPSNDNKWSMLDQMYDCVSLEVRKDYLATAEYLFEKLDESLETTRFLRIHGDLHRGNILETGDSQFVVVDFDDFVNGPSVQDMWMIFPDQDIRASKEFDIFVSGYEELRHFPDHELALVPLLRAYRIITYAGWIMQRWSDPSFRQIFPQFNTYNYWLEELESIRKIANSV